MELIYLWVEEYKNIHKQGFNFSGRYRCEYDDVKNELTIKKNEGYVHIFPDNINVTAIVGENGAGKSSIVEWLHYILNPSIGLMAPKGYAYVIVFANDEKNFCVTNHQSIKCNRSIDLTHPEYRKNDGIIISHDLEKINLLTLSASPKTLQFQG